MGDLYTVLSEVKEQQSLADLGRGFLISDQVRQPAGAAFGQRGNSLAVSVRVSSRPQASGTVIIDATSTCQNLPFDTLESLGHLKTTYRGPISKGTYIGRPFFPASVFRRCIHYTHVYTIVLNVSIPYFSSGVPPHVAKSDETPYPKGMRLTEQRMMRSMRHQCAPFLRTSRVVIS